MFKFEPSCDIFIRSEGIWVFPVEYRGGFIVMVGPAEHLSIEADDSALGKAVLSAFSRSRARKGSFTDSKPELGGFRSYGELHRGARHLRAKQTAEAIVIEAQSSSNNGGYEPTPRGKKTCPSDASVIGKTIRKLQRLCVPRDVKLIPSDRTKTSLTVPDANPNDLPIPFGYKMLWIAVPATDGEALAKMLALKQLRRCSWIDGIDLAYREGVFITPPVGGWTIAVGSLPTMDEGEVLKLLSALSQDLGEAYYFGTHRIVGYQAWAKARNGKIIRAFYYLGERGEFLQNVGRRTKEEIELNTGIEDPEAAPGEQTVLDLAGKWVLNPREIDLYIEACGPGWFGDT